MAFSVIAAFLQFLAKSRGRQERFAKSQLPLLLPTRSVRRASGFVQTPQDLPTVLHTPAQIPRQRLGK
jgi:hypothetical protein